VFPEAPHDAPEVEEVRQAYLTKVAHGALATPHQPSRWIRGAVHDHEGRIVRISQKTGGVHGHPWVPADPNRVQVRRGAQQLDGTWLYGGHWIQHFGHFVIETLSTLWPQTGPVDGLVFHKYLRKAWSVEPWQQRLLDLAGRGGLPVRVVGTGNPLRVEHLIVPSRTVVANGWAHPEARLVWDRVAASFRGRDGPRRVFLSRTRFNEGLRRRGGRKQPRTTAAKDRELDELFADFGFEVVSAERLDIDQQIAMAANTEIMAGLSGSALHLSAFAPEGTRVIEIGDSRSLGNPVGLQVVIDTVCGHRRAFIHGDRSQQEIAETVGSLDLAPHHG
jgi:capsular polysaccharide biosynthesis protein